MRCVKCNMELSEGSRFCEYCGAPQPERQRVMAQMQPRKTYCGKCGRELPAGSRFCTYCGAQQPALEVGTFGAGTKVAQPYTGPQGTGQTSSKPPKENNKNKALLIGCIAVLGILLIMAVVLLLLFVRKNKEDDWAEPEKTESRREEEIDREEEASTEEEIEEPEPAEEAVAEPEPEAEAEPEEEVEEAAGMEEIDFSIRSYEPKSQPYDLLDMSELQALNEEATITVDDRYSTSGKLYSVSEGKELDVIVYYVPDTSDILNITTLQDEGDHLHMYLYAYKEGKVLQVMNIDMKGYSPLTSDAKSMQAALYAEDCLVSMIITEDGNINASAAYFREDFESMDSDEQTMYTAKEAEYLNRAYKIYDIVSEW